MKIITKIPEIQKYLHTADIDGWLLYSFDGQNPIAEELTGLHASRRWFLFVPKNGDSKLLFQNIEESYFKKTGITYTTYTNSDSLRSELKKLLGDSKKVTMEYSPECEIPYVSKIDAGCFEMISKTGVQIVSSVELVQLTNSVWDGAEGVASHKRALDILIACVNGAWDMISKALTEGKEITEYDVQQYIAGEYKKNNLVTIYSPIVAIGKNSADAHYEPTKEQSSRIERNNVVMIDVWARENSEESIYADITWMGYTGKEIPEEVQSVWKTLTNARNAALAKAKEVRSDSPICGWQVDDAARNIIKGANLGEYFTHRTGHSIAHEVHATGVNMDNFELHDTRKIIADCGFSIEPGIYQPGKFGMRSEIDVYVDEHYNAQVLGPIQESLLTL